MANEDWPSVTIQKAMLRAFAKWLNRTGKIGVYAPEPGKTKLVRFTDEMLDRSVDLFVQEQGDGMKRDPL